MEAYMLFLTFSFFLSSFPLSHSEPDNEYSECPPSPCGKVGNISYPFWSEKTSRPRYCIISPEFKLNCPQDEHHYHSIQIDSQTFSVTQIDLHSHKMTLARMALWGTKCPKEFNNITLNYPFFNYTSNDVNSTILYDCDPLESTPNPVNPSNASMFECPINSNPRQAYFSLVDENWFNKTALGCIISITVPVLRDVARRFKEEAIDPGDVIGKGFEVEWELTEEGLCEDCRKSGGRYGYDVSFDGFTCFYPNHQSNDDQHRFCSSDDPVGAPTPEPMLQKHSMFSSS